MSRSSCALREARTRMFLRARGYVSESDFSRTPARPRPYSDQLYADQPYSDQLSPLQDQLLAAPVRAQNSLSPLAETDGTLPLASTSRSPRLENRRLTSPADSSSTAPDQTRNNITSEPQALHLPAPYNLMALRDLYSQIPDTSDRLKRFGSEVFTRHVLVAPWEEKYVTEAISRSDRRLSIHPIPLRPGTLHRNSW